MSDNIEISLPSPRSEIELDDFQNTFVGRYNELLYIFEKKVSNLNEIVKLIEPYIEIEKAYVQNFEKFIKQNKNFLGTGSLTGNSNFFDSGFDPKLSLTFDLFKHWLNILHSSSDATVRKFKTTKEELERFNSEFDHEKKKDLSSATKKLFKVRDKYYKTCREELSLASPDTTKMSTDRDAYIFHVNFVNSQYKKFFKTTFPTKLSEIRSLFIQRIHKIQLALESIVTSKIDSFKELNESINGQLLSSISSIEIEDEIEEIIKKYNPSRDKFNKTISFTFQEFSEKQPISQSLLASAVADSPIQLIPSVSSHEMSDSIQSPPGTAAPALSPKLVHTRSKMDLGLNLSLIDESSSKKTKNPFKMITSRRNHDKRRSSDFGNSGIQANAPPSPTEGYANAQDSPASSNTMSAIASPVVIPGDFGASAELSVMKVPLEVLVERETRTNPGAKLPRVETFLVESLLEKDLKGLKGLFKRGAKLPSINMLKSSLDSGIFEPPSDPYVCADVLKHWIRNLPEPLISNDL